MAAPSLHCMASLHGIAQSHQLMGKRNKKLQIYGGKQREILWSIFRACAGWSRRTQGRHVA
jgi:hypothetical protein